MAGRVVIFHPTRRDWLDYLAVKSIVSSNVTYGDGLKIAVKITIPEIDIDMHSERGMYQIIWLKVGKVREPNGGRGED